ncbi:MAG: glycosyltransferase family 2 protein [Parcubacteria group bacterium]|nr:glycosyltransferase family 2 protein [Parcubacteria group bacterium]
MINSKKISLVVPCYNEEAGLAGLFKNDLSYIDEIIVVDNNCTDNTIKIAESYGCRVVQEKVKGYGAAYKKGFKNVLNEIVVAIDGDNTYPVAEIKRLVGILIERNLDFISASRLGNGRPATMKKINYLGNFILTKMMKFLFSRSIEDSQSGMWVFKKQILKKIKPTSNGMAFSQEIKIEVLKNKYKFAEVRIPYRERLGDVKLNRWADGVKNLAWLFYKRFF